MDLVALGSTTGDAGACGFEGHWALTGHGEITIFKEASHMSEEAPLRPVTWVGTSLKDLRAFPEPVQDHVGYALYLAQRGGRHRDAKSLSGFGGAGVVEVVKDFRGDTFRAVYTVRFAEAIYVLHAFQKKSKTGRETPQRDMEMVRRRLREAEQIARERES